MKDLGIIYADLISPGNLWPFPQNNPGETKPSNIFELIEPIHLLIGGIVLVVVIIALFMISKSKKK